RVSDEQQRIEVLIREGSDLAVRLMSASATQRRWATEPGDLLKETRKTRRLVEELARSRTLYPAALRELSAAVRVLDVAPPYFSGGPHGEFEGAFDPSTLRWVKGPDGGAFSFPRLYLHLDQAREIARREQALWSLMDARRLGRRAVDSESALRFVHPPE